MSLLSEESGKLNLRQDFTITIQLSRAKEASRYDVRIGGGRGIKKNRHSKGGCVNFIV